MDVAEARAAADDGVGAGTQLEPVALEGTEGADPVDGDDGFGIGEQGHLDGLAVARHGHLELGDLPGEAKSHGLGATGPPEESIGFLEHGSARQAVGVLEVEDETVVEVGAVVGAGATDLGEGDVGIDLEGLVVKAGGFGPTFLGFSFFGRRAEPGEAQSALAGRGAGEAVAGRAGSRPEVEGALEGVPGGGEVFPGEGFEALGHGGDETLFGGIG